MNLLFENQRKVFRINNIKEPLFLISESYQKGAK